jgi:hypothetical protein
LTLKSLFKFVIDFLTYKFFPFRTKRMEPASNIFYISSLM